ncbi:MAG TPA: transporter [Candidatus Acidoferrales bacterium]|nr:transporter [Candidatus Acidoferrales bacterium]
MKGKVRLPVVSGLLIALSVAFSLTARGEEAGTGHYIPGATSSFIDMLPDRDTSTFVYANAFTYYDGSTGAAKDLELGGLLTANAKGTIYSETSLFLYQAPFKIAGGQIGVSLIVPYVWLKVQGDVLLSGRRFAPSIHREDTANGFGDVEMLPVMIGWKHGDLKWQGQFGVYAPTGTFNKGDLANIGRNYWTFEPGAALSYLSTKFGLEVTAFAGFDFNTKNGTTEYQTGDQFHLDGTVAEHLPLLGGFVGGGVNGYFYQQITGDSGSGATLGGFEGMTAGIGPIFSYAYRIGDFDLAGEAKWLPELGVANRLNGNAVWFKIGLSYASKPAEPLPGM